MTESCELFIDGQWVSGTSGHRLPVENPYDRDVWATVPQASAAEVDQAVDAARRAFAGEWGETTPARRAVLLLRLGELIEANADELAAVQVRENGKLLRELRPQTAGLAGHCRYFAGAAEALHGHSVQLSVPNMVNYTVREPVGVVAAITPWNSPLALLLWKLCPALAAGNTVVVKPSEVTPVSTLRLARLFAEAGFPPGVVNVVTGDGAVGELLVTHDGVDRIAFTGSTKVGKRIAGLAADRLTRVSLELGGKSPNIVFADADLDAAVSGVVAGIFAATGQTCLAGSRVLIEDGIYDEFADRLVERTRAIRLGDPSAESTEMGTVACQSQYDKVLSYLEIGAEEGATLLAGGGPSAEPELHKGLFVEPTIFGDVSNDMRVAREEIFGPVACLLRFGSEEEAVRIANDTRFGLAAGVWTNDVRRAHRLTRMLRAGTVWVNNYRRTNYAMPFGGYQDSGIGRENGLDAINEYTEVKAVWIDTGGKIQDPFNPRAR